MAVTMAVAAVFSSQSHLLGLFSGTSSLGNSGQINIQTGAANSGHGGAILLSVGCGNFGDGLGQIILEATEREREFH